MGTDYIVEISGTDDTGDEWEESAEMSHDEAIDALNTMADDANIEGIEIWKRSK